MKKKSLPGEIKFTKRSRNQERRKSRRREIIAFNQNNFKKRSGLAFDLNRAFKGIFTDVLREHYIDSYNDSKIYYSNPHKASVKTGRNEKCTCGSDVKYKKCCGGKI